MNKKLLLALQKRTKARLEELRTKIQNNEVREEDLEAVEQEVEELTNELKEVEDQLANLDDEDTEERDEETEQEEEQDEERNGIPEEKRNAILGAIGDGLSTRGHKSTKNKEKEIRKAFANFIVGRISEAEARSLGIEAGNGGVVVPD